MKNTIKTIAVIAAMTMGSAAMAQLGSVSGKWEGVGFTLIETSEGTWKDSNGATRSNAHVQAVLSSAATGWGNGNFSGVSGSMGVDTALAELEAEIARIHQERIDQAKQEAEFAAWVEQVRAENEAARLQAIADAEAAAQAELDRIAAEEAAAVQAELDRIAAEEQAAQDELDRIAAEEQAAIDAYEATKTAAANAIASQTALRNSIIAQYNAASQAKRTASYNLYICKDELGVDWNLDAACWKNHVDVINNSVIMSQTVDRYRAAANKLNDLKRAYNSTYGNTYTIDVVE